MTIIEWLFRPIYFVERRSSRDQLREDFGEFPPMPFRSDKLDGDFRIVRLRGAGEVYHDIQLQKKLLLAACSNIEELSLGARELLDIDRISRLSKDLDHLSQGNKAIRSIFISLVLGISFLIRLAKSLLMRKPSSRGSSRGRFIGALADEDQILIWPEHHSIANEAATVSHEHIHLLQHRKGFIKAGPISSPEEVLREDKIGDSFVLYILRSEEAEARLHEAVLCFYRNHRYLPSTPAEFLELLVASDGIGWLAEVILKADGLNLNMDIGASEERLGAALDDLAFSIRSLKTHKLETRFLTEVLPVMYGNLLTYYGLDASTYFAEIPRPNFYDELYCLRTA